MKWINSLVMLAVAAASGACGGDPEGPGKSGSSNVCGGAAVDASGCSVTLSASGDDDSTAVQTALIEASSGDDVCFCPGEYSFSRELSVTVPDVTLRGIGVERTDTILDFAAQTVGDDGLTATSDGFAVENFWLKNTPGNGIVVTGVDDVRFSNIKVTWDAGSVTENGAYAVYPTKSRRVIIENVEVVGSSDAGIYVGQCQGAIVRDSLVHGNVGGIEIENTSDSEIVNNESWDNAGGILVFTLPNLEKKDGVGAKVHGNYVHDNNRENFAVDGTVVSNIPPGTGVIVLAADEVELHDNVIENNNSTAFLLVSLETLAVLGGTTPDAETDPYMTKIYIHDNELANNGTAPREAAALLGVAPLEDVIWDGVEDASGVQLCLSDDAPSFRNFNGVMSISDTDAHSTDPTPHQCVGQTQPPMQF